MSLFLSFYLVSATAAEGEFVWKPKPTDTPNGRQDSAYVRSLFGAILGHQKIIYKFESSAQTMNQILSAQVNGSFFLPRSQRQERETAMGESFHLEWWKEMQEDGKDRFALLAGFVQYAGELEEYQELFEVSARKINAELDLFDISGGGLFQRYDITSMDELRKVADLYASLGMAYKEMAKAWRDIYYHSERAVDLVSAADGYSHTNVDFAREHLVKANRHSDAILKQIPLVETEFTSLERLFGGLHLRHFRRSLRMVSHLVTDESSEDSKVTSAASSALFRYFSEFEEIYGRAQEVLPDELLTDPELAPEWQDLVKRNNVRRLVNRLLSLNRKHHQDIRDLVLAVSDMRLVKSENNDPIASAYKELASLLSLLAKNMYELSRLDSPELEGFPTDRKQLPSRAAQMRHSVRVLILYKQNKSLNQQIESQLSTLTSNCAVNLSI